MSEQVIEIAVRRVQEDKMEDFIAARRGFIGLLRRQPGVLVDREFESFYSPATPDEGPVYVGMTAYESGEAAKQILQKVMASDEATRLMDTVDVKAFLLVTAPDDFDLATLAAKPGHVLEVAVRSVTDEDAFAATQPGFIDLLTAQDGVESNTEFVVVSDNDQNLTAGVSEYASREAFQAAGAATSTQPAAGAFFATFDPVALQYATATTAD